MQEKHLFEYAIIRVVPRVEREEFLNVGVIVYCADHNFLKTKFELNKEKLSNFSNDLDIDELKERLHAFQQICSGLPEAGSIAALPLPARFRWLTATRSTILQTSPVHPGLCTDPQETLDKVYDELVK
jgi:hypothetical protein